MLQTIKDVLDIVLGITIIIVILLVAYMTITFHKDKK